MPFDPTRSRALAAVAVPEAMARRAARLLAALTAGLLFATAGAVVAGSAGWPALALAAAASGLLLKAVWPDPWLTVGTLLDAGLVTAVTMSWPPSLF